MEEPIDVVLAGYDGAFAQNIAQVFCENACCRVVQVKTMQQARQALAHEPALLVSELILQGGDGVKLIAGKHAATTALAVSFVTDSVFYARAAEAGAIDCMALPADAHLVARRAYAALAMRHKTMRRNRIYTCMQQPGTQEQLRSGACTLLLQLGVPATLDGYRYLSFAIAACAQDASLLQTLTTRLYPLVAQTCDSTPARVERSMRYTVERIFDTAQVQTLYRFFGYSADPAKGKLSVGAFIAQMVRLLHTQQMIHI